MQLLLVELTFDNNYPAGGYRFTPQMLNIEFFVYVGTAFLYRDDKTITGGVLYFPTDETMVVFDHTLTQFTGGSDLTPYRAALAVMGY
jgi:hypothetical protein